MQRETKQITTPSGTVVTIKSFLNAGERNQLRRVFLDNVKIDSKGVAGDINASVVELAEKKLIEIGVVSFGERTSPADIMKCLEEGSPADYDFVTAELNKLSTGGLTSAK